MDLRVQKTRNAIINAFLELRAVKPLNKITVTELSKKAVISKATFYLHYKDVYDLSEQLQNKLISDIIQTIPHPETIITEPQKCTNDMIIAFLSKEALIDILFPKNEINSLSSKIEQYIKEAVYMHFPHLKDDRETNITLTFLIQGGFCAYSAFSKNNLREAQKYIGDISKIVIDNMLKNKM